MKKVIIVLSTLLMLMAIFAALCYFGYIWPNEFFANKYAVHGIDVSNHQGDIDWNKVSKNHKVDFVYIKATEGSDYRDKYFQKNWDGAAQVKLYEGAYHYFKITSSGKDQAKNFMEVVPALKGSLPPVIDIEEGGISKAAFMKELKDFIGEIEKHYNQKPILYVTYDMYKQYIQGDFEEYGIWIRDIIKPPSFNDNRDWMFWQYCNRGKLDGINSYVDLNVYSGDMDKLKALLSK